MSDGAHFLKFCTSSLNYVLNYAPSLESSMKLQYKYFL